VFVHPIQRALCIISALNLAMLAGCEEQTIKPCEVHAEMYVAGTSVEPAVSAAHRRAAAAIDCDAYQIIGRISGLDLPEAEATRLHARVRDLARLALHDVRTSAVESSRLPLSFAHQQMYEVAADAERASGSPALLAWATNPWRPLHPLDRPEGDAIGALSTALMRGERRALAFDVRSTALYPTTVRIEVSLAGLRYDALRIYQVNWTGDDLGAWAAAELQLLGDASRAQDVSVLPGVTRQLWIEVHPDAATAAGRYVGEISLIGHDGRATHVPIEIAVFKTQFPPPAMHFGGWDYSYSLGTYAPRGTNRSQLVEYLQSRHVDTPWAHRDVIDWKHLGAEGTATAPLDALPLERWLSAWPNARRFRVYVEVEDQIAGIPASDDRFAHVVTAWAQAWAAEIRRLNKSPDQFDLLLVDEPQTAAQVRTTELWAHAIRQSGTGFRIWADLVTYDSWLVEKLLDLADTVAVNLPVAESGGIHLLPQRGRTLEIYAFDGPARRLDPHGYYRLTPWRAFFMGATAVSFWSFADTGGSPSDNEFAATKQNYSPLFISHELVRPGKHMEAAAEGIQDAQYLEMLRQVATTHRVESMRLQAQDLLNQATDLLDEAPKSSESRWETRDVGKADEQRIRIGEFLDSVFEPIQHISRADNPALKGE
jgi:hypothetical protein